MAQFRAQLDDLPLSITFPDGGAERALVEYEIPNANGSDYDDMGARARKFSITAYFKNDTYDEYWKFLAIFDQGDVVHNFIHPVEGLIVGKIGSYHMRPTDSTNCIEIEFTFNEQLQGDVESKLSTLIQPQIEEHFSAGQVQAAQSLADRIIGSLGPGASAVVSRVVDVAQSFVSQFMDQARAVRSVVLQIDAAVAQFDGFMSTIAQPADSLVASIEYAKTVPGLFTQSLARALDRYMAFTETAAGSPVILLQAFYNGVAPLRNAATGFETEVSCMVAQFGALFASKLFKTDNDNREQAAAVEKISAWNEKGEYVGTAPAPEYLTVNDLERSLVIVRTFLQQALDMNRTIQALQDMAADLMRHVNSIKLEREHTYTVDIPTEMPLHLILHRYGIPLGRINRVMSFNPQIKNPSFVSGTVVLYG